jgi:hypothetical protein
MSRSRAKDGPRFPSRLLRTLLLATAAVALVPGSASAATVFGADMTQSPSFSSSLYSITNVIKPDGSADNGAPVSGVLVSARIRTTGGGGSGVIRVLRQTSHPDASTYGFLNTAPEIPATVTADATPAGHVTEVLTRRPISAGDRLAWYVNDPVGTIKEQVPGAPGQCAFAAGATHTVGTSMDHSTVGCNNLLMLLSGTIEADADGDGYGDDTQDLCPTDGTTHGACPVVTPPPTTTPTTPITSTAPTGQRAAALKKCKKKFPGRAKAQKRKKCIKKAKRLPV